MAYLFNLILFFAFGALDRIILLTAAEKSSNVGIYGGHPIPITWAPFMVSLREERNGYWPHFCGASIIHEQFILSAAHCFIPFPLDSSAYKVLYGTENIDGEGGEVMKIESISIHEQFDYKNEYDISLIKLQKPLNFSSKVDKVQLANDSVKIVPGIELNITGWGRTEYSVKDSKKLLQVVSNVADEETCRKLCYTLHISGPVICAGGNGHSGCRGDSGGPLTLGDILVGVTSGGLNCVTTGIYTDVAAFYTWIKDKMQSM